MSAIWTAIFCASLLGLLPQVTKSIAPPHSDPIRLSWFQDNTRYNFLFSPTQPLDVVELLRLPGLKDPATSCLGHAGCFFQNSTSMPVNKTYSDQSSSVFKSIESTPALTLKNCEHITLTVKHFCSTHWNPPSLLSRSYNATDCKHSIEWHSPYSCHENFTNYENPCYAHDTEGGLIDLTPWVLSSGASYKVETGPFSQSVKKLHLGVCNEASQDCGPNVSACYEGQGGMVESGFNNLTSLKFEAEQNVTVLTLLGQYDATCPDKRVKTLVKFPCKSLNGEPTIPKLTNFSQCEVTIIWPTVHACPISFQTKAKATECRIKHDSLNIDINLREVFKNQTVIEVPNVMVGGANKTALISMCSGIDQRSLRCEGKETSQVSSCLIDSRASRKNLSPTNSEVIGSVMSSYIRLADSRLFVESFAFNKTCQAPMSLNFNITGRVGTRVELFCGEDEERPKYLGVEDCVHVFEWSLRAMCLEAFNTNPPISTRPDTVDSKRAPTIAPPPSNATLSGSELKLDSESQSNRSAAELHSATSDETYKILNSTNNHQRSLDSCSGCIQESSVESTNSKLPHQADAKMSGSNKALLAVMIVGLLISFVAITLFMDRRTRHETTLNRIRRQARQAFQVPPVPYTRVNDFNTGLDL